MSKLKRQQSVPAEVIELIEHKLARVTGVSQVGMTASPGFEYGDEQPGGAPIPGGPDSGTINQECADNATTNIVIGAVAEIAAVEIIYHAHTDNAGTHYIEAGRFMLSVNAAADGSTRIGWRRDEDDTGLCLIDDTGIDTDVDSGNLRLKVTTKSLGAVCDFRATYWTVEV